MTRGSEVSRPRLVVADVGGTLVDEGGLVKRAIRRAMDESGLPTDAELERKLRGRNQRDLLAAAASAAGMVPYTVEKAMSAFGQRVVDDLLDGRCRLLPGVGDALARLRQAGIPVVVTTAFSVQLRDVLLAITGLEAHIVGKVSVEEAPGEEPRPHLTALAMQRGGVEDPAAVASIGDTAAELEAGRAAGVGWNIAVLTGRGTPDTLQAGDDDHVVADFAAAVDLLLSSR